MGIKKENQHEREEEKKVELARKTEKKEKRKGAHEVQINEYTG